VAAFAVPRQAATTSRAQLTTATRAKIVMAEVLTGGAGRSSPMRHRPGALTALAAWDSKFLFNSYMDVRYVF